VTKSAKSAHIRPLIRRDPERQQILPGDRDRSGPGADVSRLGPVDIRRPIDSSTTISILRIVLPDGGIA
jgi:hypothetical protein